ncbi:MAG: SUMF1/EgtB/PvdO family nonheme iron enzyme [Candidatus Thiodiazotropha sp.]
MTSPTLLGQLSSLHEMQQQLLSTIPAAEANRQYHPELPSLSWLYGRGVYLELHWLRVFLERDDELSRRVDHLFTPGDLSLAEQCAQLPPLEHLMRWADQIRDEHLRRLASPGALPEHPHLAEDRLAWHLVQEQAKLYEQMLEVLNQRQLQLAPPHRCRQRLTPAAPHWETRELSQGHYRIGARDEPKAYDNELPPQAVELSSFRIALTPVSNAHYLAFMQDGGYNSPELWSEEGRQWLQRTAPHHPEYWREDIEGSWYEIALNGTSDLPPDEPVAGINRYEAEAFAHWVGRQQAEYEGAVLQHEYQWEIAARSGVLQQTGRIWEWCSNNFHTYPAYQPFPGSRPTADEQQAILRGASLHTQPVLRRASLRHWALPSAHHHFAGARLVFPARHQWT